MVNQLIHILRLMEMFHGTNTAAKVIATSEFTAAEDRQVAVGDKVVFEKYSGTEVKLDGQEYIIVKEKDIIAIVE